MKYIKTLEILKYVSTEEKKLMNELRKTLRNYFGPDTPVSISKSRTTDSNLINVNIFILQRKKTELIRKFLNLLEYLNIDKNLSFSTTTEKITEILNVFKTNELNNISNIISQSNTYNL